MSYGRSNQAQLGRPVNKMYGLETLHPLVTVVDLSKATVFPTHFTLNPEKSFSRRPKDAGLHSMRMKRTSSA